MYHINSFSRLSKTILRRKIIRKQCIFFINSFSNYPKPMYGFERFLKIIQNQCKQCIGVDDDEDYEKDLGTT